VIDLDRASLDRILPAAGGAADWNDVMTRLRVQQRRRRRQIVALAAATLVVVVGTASAFGTVRDFFLDRGFVGLPPMEATPSAPQSGKLVLSFGGRSLTGAKIEVFVFADGRVIRQQEGGAPGGANELTSGFLEQRLAPDGVDLLLSEVVATGLFDHDRALLTERDFVGTIRARNGDRLVGVHRATKNIDPQQILDPEKYPDTPATPEQERALERLDALLTVPAASLPASVWQDRKVRAYVPSRYAACFVGEPSRVVPLLPKPADELVGGRDLEESPYGGHPAHYCSDVTTEEARALAKAFDEAGLERVEPSYRLAYSLEIPGPKPAVVRLWFEPRLPDGEFTCTPCG
jgi:hypothetical protein